MNNETHISDLWVLFVLISTLTGIICLMTYFGVVQ